MNESELENKINNQNSAWGKVDNAGYILGKTSIGKRISRIEISEEEGD